MTSFEDTLNPYTPLLTSYDNTYIFGRKHEMDTVLRGIATSSIVPQSYIVRGMLGVGKTAFLYHLRDHAQNPSVVQELTGARLNLTCVYIDMKKSWAPDGQETIWHVLAGGLQEALGKDTYGGNILGEDTKTSPDVLFNRLWAVLKDLAKEPAKRRIVFLLDNFDEFLKSLASRQNDERYLRVISGLAPFVITLETPPEKLYLSSEPSPLLSVMLYVVLDVLLPSAAHDLVRQPFDKTMPPDERMTDKEVEFILDISGYHPFLILVTCRAYYQQFVRVFEMGTSSASPPPLRQIIKDRDPHDQEVVGVKNRFVEFLLRRPIAKTFLDSVWNHCDRRDRELLRGLVIGPSASDLNDQQELADALQREGEHLMDLGIMSQDIRTGEYTLFSPLFEAYVRQRHILRKGTASPVEAQPRLDLMRVRDRLGPLDQGLLTTFARSPERILTFDELLQTAWQEEDLASTPNPKKLLDAAIFRLRRGIEQVTGIAGSGANYLYNMRGEGFVFLPDGDPVRFLRKRNG